MEKKVGIKTDVQNARQRTMSERSAASGNVASSMKQLANFRPDHGWAWLCVAAACFVHVFVGGLDRSFGIFYMELRDFFKVGATVTAGISGTMTSLRLLLGPLASALSNKYGTRKVAVVGGVIYAVGLTLSAFRPSIAFNYLTLGIMTGVGGALLFTPSYVCLNHHFEKRRGIAIGISTAGAGIGTFFWPQVTYLLLQNGTYPSMMLILGGISANLILCGVIFRSVNLLLIRARSRGTFIDTGPSDPNEAETMLNADAKEAEVQAAPQPSSDKVATAKKDRELRFRDEAYKACLSTPVLSSKDKTDAKISMSTPSLAHTKKQVATDAAIEQYYESVKQAAQENANLIHSVDVVLWHEEEADTSTDSSTSSEKKYFKHYCGKMLVLMKRAVRMFDLQLLTNYKFMFLAMACCCTNFAYQGIPTILLHHITLQLNLDRDTVRHIISTIGIADTTSRIVIGLLFDLPFFRKVRRFLWTIAIILIGLVIILFAVANSLIAFYVLTVFYGITTGIYTSQLTVIVVDTVPSKRLMPNAIGLTIFFRGIGVLLGIVMAGLMKDLTTTYTASFCLCGGVAILGGVLFMVTTIVCCGGVTNDPEAHFGHSKDNRSAAKH